MEILACIGRYDDAMRLFGGIFTANDSIKDVEVNARFDELRTQYEVEKHIAEKERTFHYLLFALGTNRTTLNDSVRAVTGMTPMEYMRTMKLEEARKMLDEHPDLTVEGVAYQCGFNISSTFYRLFKKQYGLTPVEYRKMA